MAALWSDAENALIERVVREVVVGGHVANTARVHARYNVMAGANASEMTKKAAAQGRPAVKTLSQVEGKLRRLREKDLSRPAGGVRKSQKKRPTALIPVDIALTAVKDEPYTSTSDRLPPADADPDKLFDEEEDFDLWLRELEGFFDMGAGASDTPSGSDTPPPTTPSSSP